MPNERPMVSVKSLGQRGSERDMVSRSMRRPPLEQLSIQSPAWRRRSSSQSA